MAENPFENLSKIAEMGAKLQKSLQDYRPPEPMYAKINIPTVEIDEESTFAYQMQQQTNQIIEKSNEQIELLTKQNEQLESNYKKLEELYNLKDIELKEAKEEARKSRRYNIAMMAITIVSMLVAIAAWLLPNILGGVA